MRIAVVEFVGKGGLIHYAFQLCRGLAARGADVTLVTSRGYELEGLEHPFAVRKIFRLWDPKPGESRLPATARRARRAGRAFLYYREWLRLAVFLGKERPDIVQLGDIRFPTDLASIRLIKGLGLAMTDVCHNLEPFAAAGRRGGMVRRSRLERRAFERIYRLFDLVLVHFETNRKAFLDLYPVDPARVAAIPHGNEALFEEIRDPGRSPESLRSDLGLPPGSPVVLFLGTLSRYKGIDLLLTAFPQVLASCPGARLVIAGFPAPDFDLKAARETVEKHGMEGSVRFLPSYVEAGSVSHLFGLASVAVFPYRVVFQSGALHVAQTLGVPTIATRVGAMPEVVRDGETGTLVPPEDPAALAGAVARLLKDPELAQRLGAGARKDAMGRFSWELVASEVLMHYDRLLASGERSGR